MHDSVRFDDLIRYLSMQKLNLKLSLINKNVETSSRLSHLINIAPIYLKLCLKNSQVKKFVFEI